MSAADIDPALAAKAGTFLWGIALGMPAALVFRALSFYAAAINHPSLAMFIPFFVTSGVTGGLHVMPLLPFPTGPLDGPFWVEGYATEMLAERHEGAQRESALVHFSRRWPR